MVNPDLTTTFVFGFGRKEKLTSNDFQAKEFFYGYEYFTKKNNTLIIEMEHFEHKGNKFLSFFDRVIRKLTELPIYTKDILSLKNFLILKKTDKLILTTELLGLSLLPLILLTKLFRNIDVYVIVMGLFGRNPSNKLILLFQRTTIGLLSKVVTNYIFIGKGEFLEAQRQNRKIKSKFVYMPFSVDTNFWSPPKNHNLKDNNEILFVGNDGKRDYKLLLKIAETLEDFNFTIITNQIKNCDLENVNLIQGNWGKGILTDQQMKNFYQNSLITIIPIRETFQPSGQSVALQSIACGTPVLISKTSGFWDKDLFKDGDNIFFVKENNTNSWKVEINKLYKNQSALENCSLNGIKTVKEHLDLTKFSQNLYRLVIQAK
jgi:glycosyltransferase involved in cell wall biosynthesis